MVTAAACARAEGPAPSESSGRRARGQRMSRRVGRLCARRADASRSRTRTCPTVGRVAGERPTQIVADASRSRGELIRLLRQSNGERLSCPATRATSGVERRRALWLARQRLHGCVAALCGRGMAADDAQEPLAIPLWSVDMSRSRSGRLTGADPPESALGADGLHHPRQGRVPEPWRQRQGPGCVVHRQRCRGARSVVAS